ncbi:MAG: class I SAM-dependent methyltransferase [Pirellulales bacterium]|nr:class I SAM-dependent methyltransferase [Pirellulales bacterium]
MQFLATTADHRSKHSWAAACRKKRFAHLHGLLSRLEGPVRILDVGGTPDYWLSLVEQIPANWHITLLNIELPAERHPDFQYLRGDARDLSQFADGSFEVVISNSVIEHVGQWSDQARMAAEVQRVGQRIYIQTPNRYFPIEPHFLTPGFQFLPEWAQVWLLQHVSLGTYGRVRDRAAAVELVREIRLLSGAEVRRLFPHASVTAEKVLGLNKSWIATAGWENPVAA